MSEPREVQVFQFLDSSRPTPVGVDDVIDFRPQVTRIDPSHPSVGGQPVAEEPPGNEPPAKPIRRLTDEPGGAPERPETTSEWVDTAPPADEANLEEIKRDLLSRANAIADSGRGPELRAALDEAGLGRIGEATEDQIAAFDKVIESFEG